MNIQGTPLGFVSSGKSDRFAIVREGLEGVLLTLMQADPGELASRPGSKGTSGRAGPFHLPVPGHAMRVFVRPFAHGGILGSLRGRRFSGPGRALCEMDVSAKCLALGLPVPEEIGMTARRLGPLNWEMEAWSWWIPDSMTLSLCLKRPDFEEAHRRELLNGVARALRQCHDAGLVHPDLNSRNVLVMPTGEGWKVLVVDLDRASLGPPLGWAARARQMRRLYRSLAKEGVLPSFLPEESFLDMVREYLGKDAGEAQMKGFLSTCRRAAAWHSLFWKRPSA